MFPPKRVTGVKGDLEAAKGVLELLLAGRDALAPVPELYAQHLQQWVVPTKHAHIR